MRNDQVYIIGGYQTDFARNWHKEGKHISAMMRAVLEGALVTTSIEPRQIKAAFIGNFAAELYCMQGHLGAFFVDFDRAFEGLPTCRFEAACASGAMAALAAIAYIQAGIYDLICVLGVEQMKTVDPRRCGEFLGAAAWYEREAKGVEFAFPKLFGTLGDEYDRRYGLDDKYLARIAEINYSNAKNNPNAQTRNWFMNFDHANTVSKYNTVIGAGIKVTDCSQVTDGAVCLFLASQQVAQQYARWHNTNLESIPRILGWGHTTAPIEFERRMKDSQSERYVLPLTRRCILEAFKSASISNCWELDAIEAHDCFTPTEYMIIDHFGLTEPGESYKAIDQGVIMMGGRLPINPSGGLIGCGHPVGATGVRQLLDAYKQVTDTAGGYQVSGARKVATLNIGGSATTNVVFVVGR